MNYKNMTVSKIRLDHYHDDYFKEGVEIEPFPYMDLFIDFRIFNGLDLEFMDQKLGEIRQIMIEIKQAHATKQALEEAKTDSS